MCLKNFFGKKTDPGIYNPVPEPPVIDGPENHMAEIKAEFDEIAARPYNQETMNCMHKSIALIKVFLKYGAVRVGLVQIVHESGQYSHAFVKYTTAFDATNTPPYFNVDYQQYLDALAQIGFTGTRIESDVMKETIDFYQA